MKNNSIKINVIQGSTGAIIVPRILRYNLPELVTPLKSQLVRPDRKKQNAARHAFAAYCIGERPRERERRTYKGGRGGGSPFKSYANERALEGQVYAYNLIRGGPTSSPSGRNGYRFLRDETRSLRNPIQIR